MTIFFNKTIIHILKLLSPNNKTLVFIVYPIEIAFTINTIIDIGKVKKIGLFASGVLFGTAGVKVLGSKDAKKFYINCLAAGLRAKDCVMTTATNIQENAEDILAEAKEINEQRNKEEVFEDESQAEAEESFNEEEAANAEA